MHFSYAEKVTYDNRYMEFYYAYTDALWEVKEQSFPANRMLYQEEMRRWGDQKRVWKMQAELRHEAFMQRFTEKKCQEEEREAKRLQLILEKRRKKKP